MRQKEDFKKIIPKSVLKIGVKLPEVKKSKSTSDLVTDVRLSNNQGNRNNESKTVASRLIEDCTIKVDLSENRFIKEDQRVNNKNKNNSGKATLFRPRFARFGHTPRPQWPHLQTSSSESAMQINSELSIMEKDDNLRQRERVRKELAAVLNLSSHDHDLSTSFSSNNKNIILSTRRRVRVVNPINYVDSNDTQIYQDNQNYSNDNIYHSSNPNLTASGSDNFLLGITNCYRCSQPVYPIEKLEPSPGQRYHPQCFRCFICETKLTLNTFCRSLYSSRDSQIYCKAHQPKQDKVILCRFSTRKSQFPAFKLPWLTSSSSRSGSELSSPDTSPCGTTSSGRRTITATHCT